MKRVGLILTFAVASFVVESSMNAAVVLFDDFNASEGHFNLAPSFSGSNLNLNASSTAVRDTTFAASREGAGFERINIVPTTVGSSSRLRFLSGGGTPSNNTAFTTTASGTDGFIGFWLKTAVSGWTAQIALDGPLPDFQGGVPKSVIADGLWHLYEWNLDLASDWGAVAGIAGNTTFEQGSQTIDSIVFRNTATPSSSIIDLDFVAKSNSGTVAAITPAAVPEASSFLAVGVVGLSALGVVWSRKKRAVVQHAA